MWYCMHVQLFYCTWCMLCVDCNLLNQSQVIVGILHFGNKTRSFLFLMAKFEKVDEFDANKEQWAQYKNISHSFLANDIDNAEKKAVRQ